ncbi:DNA/RNA non-specific endonuclease [Shinella sp. S4-D37]|uniref:DNA/RNA non-specific endonuclease n=1 Tax=Shinella sp. S4-D37 TaxID=3161999 RepID=UPI003466EBA8
MTEGPSSPVALPQAADSGRFDSLAALRVAHLDMMEGLKAGPRHGAGDIRAFVEKAAATGTLIADAEDRRAAQRILDYWSAELVADPDGEWSESGPAALARYRDQPETAGAEGPLAAATDIAPASEERPESNATSGSKAEARLHDRQVRSRRYIRIAAQARQWRETPLQGYLLSGDALDEAREFREDPDIAALLDASLQAEIVEKRREQRLKNHIIAALSTVILVLAGLAWYASDRRAEAEWQRIVAETASNEAQAARADAEKALADAEAERDALREQTLRTEAAFDDARMSQNAAEIAREVASQRVQDLETRQAALDATLGVVTTGLREGTLALKDLPEAVQTEAIGRLAGEITAGTLQLAALPQALQDAVRALVPDAPPSPFNGVLSGYDPSFLGVDIALPSLSAEQRAGAFDGGQPVHYVNYSLVLDAGRRLALFSAVNYDLALRKVVSQMPDQFSPDPRPRLRGVQADPGWFAATGIVPARLAGRNDVSWGEEEITPSWLAELTDVYTNAVPQYAGTTGMTWAALEEWVRTQHNPAANRITIFSGPVFAEPGGTIPRYFWKLAVSAAPISQRQMASQQILLPQKAMPSIGPGDGLLVDAFLVPNEPGGGYGKSAFDPDAYRVSVADLERRTGLSFAAAIKAGDSRAQLGGGPDGERLSARVAGLDGEVAADRMRLAQELVTAIRDKDLPPDEQQALVTALVNMAQDASMRTLSATGRLNLLVVLAQVPEARWEAEGWLPLKAAARRAVADLEGRAARNETTIGPQTRAPLDALKRRIGLAGPPKQRVYFQFAGMTRGSAVALGQAMQALGWDVPGEERTRAAANLNEVRYNPGSAADRAAAELLAADLVAAGQADVAARPESLVVPGQLEIWVSI